MIMATDMAVQQPVNMGKDAEILSDEKIQALLLEAEQRLLKKEASENNFGASNEDDGKNEAAADMLSLVPEASASSSGPRVRIPTLKYDRTHTPYVKEVDGVASLDNSRTVPEDLKKLSETMRVVEAPVPKSKSKEKPTSGPEWFDMPKTVLTDELKRDLQILRMRNVLDPKRHYKKENGKAKPAEYSQVGTIIEGNTEFFSARIAKKDRKRTFAEEALAAEKESGRFKRKYNEIQEAKTSGKKAYYKSVQEKRARSRKNR